MGTPQRCCPRPHAAVAQLGASILGCQAAGWAPPNLPPPQHSPRRSGVWAAAAAAPPSFPLSPNACRSSSTPATAHTTRPARSAPHPQGASRQCGGAGVEVCTGAVGSTPTPPARHVPVNGGTPLPCNWVGVATPVPPASTRRRRPPRRGKRWTATRGAGRRPAHGCGRHRRGRYGRPASPVAPPPPRGGLVRVRSRGNQERGGGRTPPPRLPPVLVERLQTRPTWSRVQHHPAATCSSPT